MNDIVTKCIIPKIPAPFEFYQNEIITCTDSFNQFLYYAILFGEVGDCALPVKLILCWRAWWGKMRFFVVELFILCNDLLFTFDTFNSIFGV